MTQEDKELLLQDLCARLPYGVKVQDELGRVNKLVIGNSDLVRLYYNDFSIYSEEKLSLPYLRPMSSMTEEEKEEVKPLFSEFTDEFGKRVLVVRQNKMVLYQDWLNKNMFDCRGLISMGLALEAPKEMYNLNK